MEMHQLRYVVAVAQAGNFSRAADLCNVSQPSLSQQIIKLEEELNIRIFERLSRKTILTAQGEVFTKRAQKILREAHLAAEEAREATERVTGLTRMGVIPSVAPYFIPGVLAKFCEQYPGVEMVMHEETTQRILQQLLVGETDVAVASLPIDQRYYVVHELFCEELLLALPARHRLVESAEVTLKDLDGESFILMKEGHCLGDQVLRFCQNEEFRPTITLWSGQIETVLGLIRCGMGVSLIPQMAATKGGDAGIVYRSLSGAVPRRQIAILWAKQRPPGRATKAFIKEMGRYVNGSTVVQNKV